MLIPKPYGEGLADMIPISVGRGSEAQIIGKPDKWRDGLFHFSLMTSFRGTWLGADECSLECYLLCL